MLRFYSSSLAITRSMLGGDFAIRGLHLPWLVLNSLGAGNTTSNTVSWWMDLDVKSRVLWGFIGLVKCAFIYKLLVSLYHQVLIQNVSCVIMLFVIRHLDPHTHLSFFLSFFQLIYFFSVKATFFTFKNVLFALFLCAYLDFDEIFKWSLI